MTALANRLIARFITLEVALLATRARLAAGTDAEALHDLRIVVRRLRSLLRPLRGLPGVDSLEAATAEVGGLSSPLRDLEVLIGELERHGLDRPAVVRRRILQQGYQDLLAGSALTHLRQCLTQWPGLLREVEREGLLKGMEKKLHRRLLRQQRALQAALADPAHDRHRLRLLVKRVRYAAEVWPHQLSVPPDALKAAQSALGDWHDHLQWCLRAGTEADLQPCLVRWQRELAAAEVEADAVLRQLQEALEAAASAD
ncbi:CHAD domain protein [compost metagenome]